MMLKPPIRRWLPPAQLFHWTDCIVHHTGSPDDPHTMQADQVIDYHVRIKHWKDAGYNFLFEMIDDIPVGIFLRPLTTNGSHARGWNTTAVGCVFQGNFMTAPPPKVLIDMAVEDVFRPIIVGLLGIAPDRIRPHRDVGRTECPGSQFPITLITDQL